MAHPHEPYPSLPRCWESLIELRKARRCVENWDRYGNKKWIREYYRHMNKCLRLNWALTGISLLPLARFQRLTED